MKPDNTADYTVCTIWGVTYANTYYLLGLHLVRLTYYRVLTLARSLIEQYRPMYVLVEDAASGAALAQELARDNMYVTVAIRPRIDKLSRAQAATPAFEAGRVLIPETAEWRLDYIQELTGFPGTRFDDQVDSPSQFINWAEERFRIVDYHPFPGSIVKEDSWME